MNYSKPEINDLGSAVQVIEQTGQKFSSDSDPQRKVTNPAYDLDE